MGKTHISEHKSIFLGPQIKIIDIGNEELISMEEKWVELRGNRPAQLPMIPVRI